MNRCKSFLLCSLSDFSWRGRSFHEVFCVAVALCYLVCVCVCVSNPENPLLYFMLHMCFWCLMYSGRRVCQFVSFNYLVLMQLSQVPSHESSRYPPILFV
jgi:hypothetical protein